MIFRPDRCTIRASLERREARRRRALEAAAELPSIARATPWDMGTLAALAREGLLEELPERNRIGDLRYRITAAGRAAINGGRP